MMRLGYIAALALMLGTPALAQSSSQRTEWNRPFTPFRIIGNVYYVGTKGLSAFLVTGPQGHVLIDGALPESAPLIAANIESLGFKLTDVKYLLINHTHYDHAGGLAELQRLTGAALVTTAAEKADLAAGRTIGRDDIDGFPAATVDRIIGEGDTVRIGPVTLTAILSPGHTKGGISWTTRADGKTVLFATSLTVAGQNLIGDPLYPTAAADFRRTLARLRTIPADVFLNFHPEFFAMETRRTKQQAGDVNAFVDPLETRRQVDRAAHDFAIELTRQQATAKAKE